MRKFKVDKYTNLMNVSDKIISISVLKENYLNKAVTNLYLASTSDSLVATSGL